MCIVSTEHIPRVPYFLFRTNQHSRTHSPTETFMTVDRMCRHVLIAMHKIFALYHKPGLFALSYLTEERREDVRHNTKPRRCRFSLTLSILTLGVVKSYREWYSATLNTTINLAVEEIYRECWVQHRNKITSY